MRIKPYKGWLTVVLATAAAVIFAATASASHHATVAASKAPIVIGQVGDYTGPVPGLTAQGYGLEAWVKATNASGGIDHHRIVLYTADAQGTPTGEVSQTIQTVQSHHPVALAGMAITTVAGIAKFVAQQNIPVIGGNTNDGAWLTNPDFYNPGGSLMGSYLGGFFAVPKPKDKTGLVYCSESPGCSLVYTLGFTDGLVKANGGDPVYSVETSLASPSFTAQCLAAKQAGVKVLAVAFDPTNIARFEQSCAAQGYSPEYAISGSVASNAVAATGLTTIAGGIQVPWFENTPALNRLRAAINKYVPSAAPIDASTVEGWTAGVALGQAISDYYSAHPKANALTRSDVKQGLAMIKNDTFGGLTPPITFTAHGIQKESNCWFSFIAKNKTWAPNGKTAICPPASGAAAISKATKALTG